SLIMRIFFQRLRVRKNLVVTKSLVKKIQIVTGYLMELHEMRCDKSMGETFVFSERHEKNYFRFDVLSIDLSRKRSFLRKPACRFICNKAESQPLPECFIGINVCA